MKKLRRKSLTTRTNFVMAAPSMVNWTASGDETVAKLVTINLRDLERRGFIESSPAGENLLRWTACDRPASFEWPHWRCEPRQGYLGPAWTIIANVGDHPELRTDMTFTQAMLGDYPRDHIEECADAVKHMQELIAEAIALRSSGEPCECGGCDVHEGATDTGQGSPHEPGNGQRAP